MGTRIEVDKLDFQKVEVLWSEKYACPIYKVAGLNGPEYYIENTGEYAGYFDEAIIIVTTKPPSDTKSNIRGVK